MTQLRRGLVAVAAMLALASGASSQFGDPLNPYGGPTTPGSPAKVRSATFASAQVAAGGEGVLVLRVKMKPTWHIYSVKPSPDYGATTVAIKTAGVRIAGAITEPEPHVQEVGGLRQLIHEGEVELRVPVAFADTLSGPIRVRGVLGFTACDPSACNPPDEEAFTAEVTIMSPGETTGAATDRGPGEAVPLSGKGEFVAQVRLSAAPVEPGEEVWLDLDVTMGAGYHIYSVEPLGQYSVPTALTLDPAPSLFEVVGGVVEPTPKLHKAEEEWDSDSAYHEGSFKLRQKLRIAADARPGRHQIKARLSYQSCDASGCINDDLEFAVPVVVAGEAAAPGGSGVDAAATARILAAVEGLAADLRGELEEVRGLVERVAPKERPAPPPAPTWSILNPRLEVLSGKARAGESARVRLTFSTPEKADLQSHQDVFIDFVASHTKRQDGGDSPPKPRVAAVEAVSTKSADNGLAHAIEFDVVATQLARSGREDLVLDVSVPFSKSGNSFSKEIAALPLALDFGLPNLWGWVLKAVLAALLALLTPCVFPMIPVTVAFFTKQAVGSKQNPLLLPGVYVVGIIVSFVVIGTAFTAFFGAAGGQILATNGYLQGFFGLLFVVFSLSLFGVFALRPPAFLMARAGKVQGKGGIVGTLGMGLLFSLTSFTCTAPLVGLILVDAAESGEWMMPIIGMFAFSAVLAFPFFFLALFPRVMSNLPKSGGWMNRVKVTLGFLELAFALKFIGAMDAYFGWGLFTRGVILWMWVVIFFMNGLYLLGLFSFAHEAKPDRIGAIGGCVAVVLIVFGLHIQEGAQGARMPALVESLMPPPLAHESTGGTVGWAGRLADDPEAARDRARELGVPLFVDFTGFT